MFPKNFIYFHYITNQHQEASITMKNIAQQFTGRGLDNSAERQSRYQKQKSPTKSMADLNKVFNNLDTTDRVRCIPCDVTNPPRPAVAYAGRTIYKCVICLRLIPSPYN